MISHGSKVIFVDSRRAAHNALVTEIHGAPEMLPSINLVFVTTDEDRRDSYGRQIERQSSVVHKRDQTGGGMFWQEA